jgi:hypothetical protein
VLITDRGEFMDNALDKVYRSVASRGADGPVLFSIQRGCRAAEPTLQGACALCSSTLAAQWRRAGPITTELNGEARHPCEPPTSHGRLAQRVEPRRISRHAVAALLS